MIDIAEIFRTQFSDLQNFQYLKKYSKKKKQKKSDPYK